MAEYKVAQDVEAEDKLLGPFSFRQFIYLIVVAIAIALAWGLAQIFVGLAIIPLPIILFFGALALPLRKDQPMEIYLAALASYLLKPHFRVWSPDGIEHSIEITAPKTVEESLTKDLSENEAEKRLSYLANIADTEGWSIRHATEPNPNSSMNPDQYYAAQQTPDMLDDSGGVARNFDTMITRADQQRRQQIINNMHNPQAQNLQQPQQQDQYIPPEPETTNYSSQTFFNGSAPRYNPYPNMHQSVIPPEGQTPHQQTPVPSQQITPQNREQTPDVRQVQADTSIQPAQPQESTSNNTVSTDIMNLANSNSLSIETIQHEANRLKKKEEKKDDEVFISLH